MLAQNFKTPNDLMITGAQFSALLTVLGMLERGEIPYESKPCEIGGLREILPLHFNLAHWRCGTAACIGGWAEYVGKVDFRKSDSTSGLKRLVYPVDYA